MAERSERHLAEAILAPLKTPRGLNSAALRVSDYSWGSLFFILCGLKSEKRGLRQCGAVGGSPFLLLLFWFSNIHFYIEGLFRGVGALYKGLRVLENAKFLAFAYR